MELLYLTDPMCSWCYGFASVLAEVEARLPSKIPVRYVMGGLAPDSDEPMVESTRAMVQAAWAAVERTTGAVFNHDFWTGCEPRRSTYPACRAVLAAASLGAGREVFLGIQRAYYQEARNPSDLDVLAAIAVEEGLDGQAFQEALSSSAIEAALTSHLAESERVGATVGSTGFPTLVLATDSGTHLLTSGYRSWPDLEPRLRELDLL